MNLKNRSALQHKIKPIETGMPEAVCVLQPADLRASYEDLSKGIHKTEKFLLRFLSNLLLNENYSLKNREMHIQFVEPLNDLVKVENDPVNDLVNRSILQHLKQNPKANYRELADKIGNSTSTIKRHIQKLKKTGIIERIGSDKGGYWKIIEK